MALGAQPAFPEGWIQICPGGPRHRYREGGLIEREGADVVRAPGKVALVQKVIAAYGDIILEKSAAHGIPAHWLAGLIAFESGGNPNAASPGVGAKGLTQVLPSTAKGMGFDPDRLLEPAYNIEVGLTYLDTQVKRYGLDWPALAAAYNAGSVRCAATTKCKKAGVLDGTTAENSWGTIEDCQNGKSSRYVEVLVGAANEALLLGFPDGSGWQGEGSTLHTSLQNALAFFVAAGTAGAAAYFVLRD